MRRRSFFAALSAMLATTPNLAKAQFNEDEVFSSGIIVTNDSQVVASGDVTVNQVAEVTSSQEVHQHDIFQDPYDGMQALVCNPGHVIASPRTGQLFYQANDCCYYVACADSCRKKGCEGSHCG